MQYDKKDLQFVTHMVEKVEAHEDGWVVTCDGLCLNVPNKHQKVAPVPGETAMYFGRGTWYPVRGVVIGGRTYWYMSARQEKTKNIAEVAKKKREDRAKFAAGRAEFDAKVAALPVPLRERMEGFLATSPEWGPTCGAYELFCCMQGAAFADALKTPEAIVSFRKLDSTAQRELVPAMDDGHSGNTFGMSTLLAHALLTMPDKLSAMHAAFCPLMGCTDAGCMAGRPNKGVSRITNCYGRPSLVRAVVGGRTLPRGWVTAPLGLTADGEAKRVAVLMRDGRVDSVVVVPVDHATTPDSDVYVRPHAHDKPNPTRIQRTVGDGRWQWVA